MRHPLDLVFFNFRGSFILFLSFYVYLICFISILLDLFVLYHLLPQNLIKWVIGGVFHTQLAKSTSQLEIWSENWTDVLMKKLKFFKIHKTYKWATFCNTKDSIKLKNKANVIYRIAWPFCLSKYIGKTDHNLITGFGEMALNLTIQCINIWAIVQV